MLTTINKDRDFARKSNPLQTVNSIQRTERRLNKKKESERCRRKKINEKLQKVHKLTLDIIGRDQRVPSNVRLEKVEMLDFCYDVLKGLNNLLMESPGLQQQLKDSLKVMDENDNPSKATPFSDSGFQDVSSGSVNSFTRSPPSSILRQKCKSYSTSSTRQSVWRPYL